MTGTAGSGGSPPAADCTSNPIWGSCFHQMLVPCYQPDLSGMCTDSATVVNWEDGHRAQRAGADPGMYAPGGVTCMTFTLDFMGNDLVLTYTDGTDAIVEVQDSTTETSTATCPDGSTFRATFEEGREYNECVGLACPGTL